MSGTSTRPFSPTAAFVFVARNRDPEKTTIMLVSVDGKAFDRWFRVGLRGDLRRPRLPALARDMLWSRGDSTRLASGRSAIPAPFFENVRYATEDNRLSVSAAGNRVRISLVPAEKARVGGSQRARARHVSSRSGL